MSTFTSEAEVYETLGAFVGEVAVSDGFAPMLTEIGDGVQFSLSDPGASILVRLDTSSPFTVLGAPDGTATARFQLPSSTLHRIFLGQDSFVAAVNRGDLVITDAVTALLPLLAPLTFAAFPRYQALLQEIGRVDLL